jgi:hypothetical protein
MEDSNNNQVTSLFEHHNLNTVTVNLSPVNGSVDGTHTDLHHSVTENKKKRGRPRKYESPEEALAGRKAIAARKAAAAAAAAASATTSFSSSNHNKPKKFHSSSLGFVIMNFFFF